MHGVATTDVDDDEDDRAVRSHGSSSFLERARRRARGVAVAWESAKRVTKASEELAEKFTRAAAVRMGFAITTT